MGSWPSRSPGVPFSKFKIRSLQYERLAPSGASGPAITNVPYGGLLIPPFFQNHAQLAKNSFAAKVRNSLQDGRRAFGDRDSTPYP